MVAEEVGASLIRSLQEEMNDLLDGMQMTTQ